MFDADVTSENVYEIANITPIDVKVYYENKTPYLDYTGEALGPDNSRIKIHIPKVRLDFRRFHCERREYRHYTGLILGFEQHAVFESDNHITFEIVEREMTKEQIEKQLGYKIKIKG